MTVFNLTADQIENALDFCHSTEEIEADANASMDEDWAREEALRQMREDEAKKELEFEAKILDCGYSIGELRRAFHLVANQENWKYPIDAKVSANLQRVVGLAITFMTGSDATFQDAGHGLIRVVAEGYYSAVGA